MDLINGSNLAEFQYYIDKWQPIKQQLKEKFNFATKDIPASELTEEFLLRAIFGEDRNTKAEFDKTIEMSDTTDVNTLYLCVQRMISLSNTYHPAYAWLGLFCEGALESIQDAQFWYNKGVHHGNGISMYRLGLLYLNKRVEYSFSFVAEELICKSLEYGVPQAQIIIDKYFK